MDPKPEEVLNRINEAKLLAKDDGVTPLTWSKCKVEYYKTEIARKRREHESTMEDEHLRDVWEVVVEHFKRFS